MAWLNPGEQLRGLSVQPPGGGRAKFRIIATIIDADGNRSQRQIQDTRIDSINVTFKLKKVSAEGASQQLEKLKEKIRAELDAPLKAESRLKYDAIHQSIFESYWQDYQSKMPRTLKNEPSTINDIKRALRAVSHLNLQTSTAMEFREAVNRLPKKKRPKIIDRLNSVLAFLDRDFSIPRESKMSSEAAVFVTWPDLNRITNRLDGTYGEKFKYEADLFKTMAETLFATGVRYGELFELNRTKLDKTGRLIHVSRQWASRYNPATGKWEIEKGANRKNASTRPSYHALILKEGVNALSKWLSYLETAPDAELDHLRISDIFGNTISSNAVNTFPNDPTKHITIHSLRASYAIYLLESGMNIGQAATYIGDTDRVVREYYSRWAITDQMKRNDLALVDEAAKKTKEASKKRV